MRHTLFLIFAAVISTLAFKASAAPPPTPDKIFISSEAARALFDSDKAMDPKKGDGFRRLQRAFGIEDQYSVAQVLAIRLGKPDATTADMRERRRPQTGVVPRDAFTRKEVSDRFEALEKIKPAAKGLVKRLDDRVPGSDWFTTEQVLNAENFETLDPRTPEAQANLEALQHAYRDVRKSDFNERQGFRAPRIRRDWRDVLFDEDASQQSTEKKVLALGDLEGALFSFTHDGKANADMWAAHAAVILPYTREWLTGSSFSLRRFALAPSVTYDRVTTSGDPAVEVDSLLYRAGLYMDFYGQTRQREASDPIVGYGLQVRAAGVYVTDHDHRAGLWGFEADFEPRFHAGAPGLGYRTILVGKEHAIRKDGSDISILEGQLRTWLHMEGGDIENTGPAWKAVTGSFFRLGPTVQLQLSMPSLPGDRALSLTAVYSYLGTVSGSDDTNNYFRASLSYDLFRNVEFNHKVSLSASYEKGGLNFTKQKVDTFTVGLGVLF